MSSRKQQNEIVHAQRRVESWLERRADVWRPRKSAMRRTLLAAAGARLRLPPARIEGLLALGPAAELLDRMATEEALLRRPADGSGSLLDEYIATRGNREKPLGRRFLRGLADSVATLHDVLGYRQGRWIELRPVGTERSPTRASVAMPAHALEPGTRYLARLVTMPHGTELSDLALTILPDVTLPAVARSPDLVVDTFARWVEGYVRAASTIEDAAGPSEEATATGAADRERVGRPRAGADRKPPGRDGTGRTGPDRSGAKSAPTDDPERDRLLGRVRKLYAMAQETEASPHEAEIALRRCNSLMAKFGITEADLETSEFGTATSPRRTVAMHVRYFGSAIALLHDVLFVTGGPEGLEFRGYGIDVQVARLTLEYLEGAIERALSARRRAGGFPAGRSAAYDYRVAFALEVYQRVDAIVAERKATERAASPTGTALTIRKREIVDRECGAGLSTHSVRHRGTRDREAAAAGRADGSRVSLDPQVDSDAPAPRLAGR